ncbi:MAG: guanine deaminase, partial [Rhodoferax sp.]
MQAYRAAILRFATDRDPGQAALYEQDGLLVVGPNAQGRQVVQAVGPWHALRARFPELAVTHWPGRIVVPGFVDLHSHY